MAGWMIGHISRLVTLVHVKLLHVHHFLHITSDSDAKRALFIVLTQYYYRRADIYFTIFHCDLSCFGGTGRLT